MEMTESEARGFVQGKLNCMKKCVIFDCKNTNECDNCDYCYSQGTFGKQKEAFEMAIKALEKQIPKEAIITGHNNSVNTDVGECPICNDAILRACDCTYCPNCGQRLEW